MPTVRTNDIETYYETRGDGPPVIFIHGALSDHTAAAGQLAAFEDEFQAIAYDVRGHGGTPNPGDEPYSVADLAEDLDAFITALDIQQPVLCGVSMGGMIAQTYASRHPDRLGGLVLADTYTPPFLSRRDRIERASLVNAITAVIRLVGYNRAKGVIMWFGRKLERGQTESLQTDAFPDMDTRAAVNSLQAAATFDRVDVDLTAITVPTLVLYGEHETSIISRHAPVLDREIPDATTQVVPDAGHASPWDNPEFFNESVRSFVTDRVLVEVA